MRSYIYIFFSIIVLQACAQDTKNTPLDSTSIEQDTLEKLEIEIINPKGMTVATRFNAPAGFQREQSDSASYAFYLQHLPLKKHGSLVKHYDGTSKPNYQVYDAVVDLKIGSRDLHQCADAIMRLRAEYLWNQKRYDEIHFNFTNGFRVDYSEWMKGRRMIVKGNKTYWSNRNAPSNTYTDFWKYMELIFNYAGTLSLSRELKSVPINDLQIGDVFIKGGSPGHAIVVIDLASNSTGEKMFLLAQSYMPAQDLQILQNPNNTDSPWYAVRDCDGGLETPEWGFEEGSLKRF